VDELTQFNLFNQLSVELTLAALLHCRPTILRDHSLHVIFPALTSNVAWTQLTRHSQIFFIANFDNMQQLCCLSLLECFRNGEIQLSFCIWFTVIKFSHNMFLYGLKWLIILYRVSSTIDCDLRVVDRRSSSSSSRLNSGHLRSIDGCRLRTNATAREQRNEV